MGEAEGRRLKGGTFVQDYAELRVRMVVESELEVLLKDV